MKLRLFALRNITTNRRIPDVYFPDKPAARKERDRLNAQSDSDRYVITTGPDHRRFNPN